jgi:hypothetical protein
MASTYIHLYCHLALFCVAQLGYAYIFRYRKTIADPEVAEKVSNLPYISRIRSLRTADDFHYLINLLEIILSQHIPGYRPHTGEA